MINKSDLIDVWQRQSLSIEGDDPFEDSHVYWLMAGDYYADIRWPRENSAVSTQMPSLFCFAGRAILESTGESTAMRFLHDLDLQPDAREDVGQLVLTPSLLEEHGEVELDGNTIRFKEVWQPLKTGANHPGIQVAVLTRANDNKDKTTDTHLGFMVRVNEYALALRAAGAEGNQQFDAILLHWSENTWHRLQEIGDPLDLHRQMLRFFAGDLPAKWQLRVGESGLQQPTQHNTVET